MFCKTNNACSVCDPSMCHGFNISMIYRELLYEKKSNNEHYKSE